MAPFVRQHRIFEKRRRERLGRMFVDGDIDEIIRMAENRGKLNRFERYINSRLFPLG